MHECPECGEVCGCDDDDVMQEGLYVGCKHLCDDEDLAEADDEDAMRYDEEE